MIPRDWDFEGGSFVEVRPPSAERLLWNKIYLYRRILAVLIVAEVASVITLAVVVTKQ